MEPSPLHFVSHTHYYRGGDVVVDAAAAIAPGVVLRAAPGGSIRISAGACVGAGVVIQAKHGCVFIEAGVSLGTGGLLVNHWALAQASTT
ncbi:MAG: carbon dioxide concentrating mechanism protein, partial [Cyanobacteria bacterium J06607_17]